MAIISELSDDLLVKILSYLPTQVAASTMILSKQWQFLWMWLPKLEFVDSHIFDFETLQCFLLRNLPLYRAPVIDSFRISLYSEDIDPEEDVKLWVLFAVSRGVRELDICYSSDYGDDILPISLYTSKSLVTLKLDGIIYMDVPRMVFLPSLKTLRLTFVTYDNKDSLPWLLSNCPVLEDLLVSGFGQFGKMIIIVPSLQRLSLEISDCDLDEFVIDTPSLEYLDLDCDEKVMYTSIKNMPKLKEIFVEGSFSLFDKLIGSISSVTHLKLCLSSDNISEVVFEGSFVLNKLKHLKLCTSHDFSSHVLVQLLKISPNLQELELITTFHHKTYRHYWNQPSIVPKCILTSLEIFKWLRYQGNREERELVIYILQNASSLKTARIFLYEYNLDKILEMRKELELSSRASTTCQLVFH